MQSLRSKRQRLKSWCLLFARFTASSVAAFSARLFCSLRSLLVGSHFSAFFCGDFGRGMVTKKEPAGIIIALVFLKPNFFGIVILPRSSISTTDIEIPSSILCTRNLNLPHITVFVVYESASDATDKVSEASISF